MKYTFFGFNILPRNNKVVGSNFDPLRTKSQVFDQALHKCHQLIVYFLPRVLQINHLPNAPYCQAFSDRVVVVRMKQLQSQTVLHAGEDCHWHIQQPSLAPQIQPTQQIKFSTQSFFSKILALVGTQALTFMFLQATIHNELSDFYFVTNICEYIVLLCKVLS